MKRVVNLKNNSTVVENLEVADTFITRLMGLMGRPLLSQGAGLLLMQSGNSIHTCFMKFAIDVAFISKGGKVEYIKSRIKPWRMVIAPLLKSTDCLELPEGRLEQTDTKVGDILRVEN